MATGRSSALWIDFWPTNCQQTVKQFRQAVKKFKQFKPNQKQWQKGQSKPNQKKTAEIAIQTEGMSEADKETEGENKTEADDVCWWCRNVYVFITVSAVCQWTAYGIWLMLVAYSIHSTIHNLL